MNLNACWLRGVVTVRRLWSVQFGQKRDRVSRTANQEFLLLELHDRQESLFAERESFRQSQAARRAASIEALPNSRREDGEHAAHRGPKTLTNGFTHTALSLCGDPSILRRGAAALSRRVICSATAPQGLARAKQWDRA